MYTLTQLITLFHANKPNTNICVYIYITLYATLNDYMHGLVLDIYGRGYRVLP